MKLPDFDLPRGAARVSGLSAAAMGLFLTSRDEPLIILAPTEDRAGVLRDELDFFSKVLGRPRPLLLPGLDRADARDRLLAIQAVIEEGPAKVVSWPEAAGGAIWRPDAFERASFVLRPGDEVDLSFLTDLLREMGYRRVNLVAEAGEFAVRGGIVDVFPVLEEHPYRIEFYGDEIEAVRAFDLETQRSFRAEEHLSILPAREPDDGHSVFRALPRHRVVYVDPLEEVDGLPAPDLRVASLRIDEEGATVALASVEGFGLTARERRVSGEGIETIGPRVRALLEDYRVLFSSRSHGEAERIGELLSEAGVAAPVIAPGEIGDYAGAVAVTEGRLSGGFADRESGFMLLTAEDLFGARPRYRPRRRSRAAGLIQSLDDLGAGDLIVHVDHGVGRFVGMKKVRVEDVEGDVLHLEYAEGACLYLPVDRIDRIRKYHGSSEGAPRLDRLGGTSWDKVKRRVRRRVREMAEELIRIYAARETAEGYAFSPEGTFHREFAEAFPYEETPDQQTSIREVLDDMAAARPMDRLLCGDVGYDKTEVAMRAAFAGVFDGRQVAVLVPTTILAEQHYENFSARFGAFPVRIDYLSRFKSLKERRETLRRLTAGEVDIIIGTHALLSRSVTIPNLGLLIIDEEHKFGVAHKEKIKALRKNIDVLTLSATPIPRTLHMALSGIRGISTIETPPEERLAVKTFVVRYRPGVIQEALEREFARGGQAFFVHNRIETIYKTGAFLQGLLPGRRIAVAHGRMNERELEAVMHEFHRGELDLLLCTSIIGSGLDVPRANTIIVDRADRFGLADLYQLKGRVGRADVRAFAYFLVPPGDQLATEARKRLEAVQELSFLGAGFRLAMKDLEIRGAGNLLGAQQSGHIDAVGYDLYVEMLETAVQELRGGKERPRPEPVLEFQVNAAIPESYLDDTTLRFTLYRRIASLRRMEALDALRNEIRDRFGPPPEALERLLRVAELRLLCREAGIVRLAEKGVAMHLLADPENAVLTSRLLGLPEAIEEPVRFLPEGGVAIDFPNRSFDAVAGRLQAILAMLARDGGATS